MLTSHHMVVSQCKMHTICNKNPLPTLNDIAYPSLVLQLTVALLLHSRNDKQMKTLCYWYEAYPHKFIVWILNVLEGHQFNGTTHLTPTMEDLFLGCAKKTRKDYLVSPHTEPKTLAWDNKYKPNGASMFLSQMVLFKCYVAPKIVAVLCVLVMLVGYMT